MLHTVTGIDAKPESQLETIASRIKEETSQIDIIFRTIDDLADRAFGGGGAEAANSRPRPIATGTIGLIDEALQDLNEARARLSNACDRLRSLA